MSAGTFRSDVRQVLDVRRHEERTGLQDKHLQPVCLTQAEYLLRAVSAEHASADDERVELLGAVGGRLLTRVAHEPAEHIEGQSCALYIGLRGDWLTGIHQPVERHRSSQAGGLTQAVITVTSRPVNPLVTIGASE
jgi:hypothetical protein